MVLLGRVFQQKLRGWHQHSTFRSGASPLAGTGIRTALVRVSAVDLWPNVWLRRHCCFTKGRGLHSRQRDWRGSPANLVSGGSTWRRCQGIRRPQRPAHVRLRQVLTRWSRAASRLTASPGRAGEIPCAPPRCAARARCRGITSVTFASDALLAARHDALLELRPDGTWTWRPAHEKSPAA